jgi:pilus biogenesis lipoprotein CpaD
MRSSIALRSAAGAGPAAVRLLTLSLLALVVAGCKTTGEPGAYVAGWTLIDPAQRHPIMVSEQPATMTTRIPRGSSGLTGPQKEQVAKFLERYRASDAGNSKLVIFVPTGSPNESAAVRAVSDVRQMIGEFGFPESNIAIEPYQEHRDASAPIRLSYLRYVPISAAPRSAISRPRSPIPPICSAPARWIRLTRSAAPWSWTATAKAGRPAPIEPPTSASACAATSRGE